MRPICKKALALALCLVCLLAMTACGTQTAAGTTGTQSQTPPTTQPGQTTPEAQEYPEGTVWIQLSDSGITVDGDPVATEDTAPVYAANDIVYYESGKDISYGAGSDADAHDAAEAAGHTVVHITQAGTYRISGKLSAGQIAVDLGKGAKTDPTAVVNLILDGADITCTVAPAIIFYKVYECDQAWVDFDDNDTEGYEATWNVDTTAAGANVILARGTENTVRGAYVAKIYKPESVELSEDGREVESAKKLHKYDGALYSKMSMNVSGEGKLTIYATNEGLDSELHLTINSGDIQIFSGNDGINTNEDNVSVTTVNGGSLTITVTGETGEGDGIDSNGWLVINGGTVTAYACSSSMDSGVDADMGISINGGTVLATGNMYDQIDGDGQTYVVLQFAKRQTGGRVYSLKNSNGEVVGQWNPANDFQYLTFSSPQLAAGDYTLWLGDTQLSGQYGGAFDSVPGGGGWGHGSAGGEEPGSGIVPDGGGDRLPDNGNIGQKPDYDVPPPSDAAPSDPAELFGEKPQGDMPQGGPDGQMPQGGFDIRVDSREITVFPIVEGVNYFSNIG